jgi:Fe2+ transport system protein B
VGLGDGFAGFYTSPSGSFISKRKAFSFLELPTYRSPRWNNVAQTMLEKAKIFVTDAGKIIMIISLILWGLSSYGPGDRMAKLEQQYEAAKAQGTTDERQKANMQLPNWKTPMPVFLAKALSRPSDRWAMTGVLAFL